MAGTRNVKSNLNMQRNITIPGKNPVRGGEEDSSDSEDVEEYEAPSDEESYEDDGLDGDNKNDDDDDDDDEDDGSNVIQTHEKSEDSEEEEEDDDDEDDDGQSDSIDHHGNAQTEEDIKKEISTMSFEDIMKLQSKVGTKAYNEIAYGVTKRPQDTKKRKRLNKNRPMEISSKKPASFLRQVVPVKKKTFRDPRFDDLSGEYKPEIFEKTYKFINDIKQKEMEAVQKQLKKKKLKIHQKEKLDFLLKRMVNQERARKSREEQREKEVELKRQQREQAGQGLRPYFLKKSDKKKLQLADKYNTLKKSGKLENFIGKKRKRNAVKDRRKLPQRTQTQ